MALLSGLVEKLPWGEKYLGVCIGNPALLKPYYCLPQGQSKEADSDLPLCWYNSTTG